MNGFFERFFNFNINNTNARQEYLAGLTTFLTMVYIIFVNPNVLSIAGMDGGAVFVATCLVVAFGSFLIGLTSGYPIAIAPAMAINVYFTYVVVQGMGFAWPDALGAVFVASILFFLVAISPLRSWIIRSIPECLNAAITVGLGLFISLVALKSSGLVVVTHGSTLSMGPLDAQELLFAVGFLLIVILDFYQVRGAILFGILLTTMLAIFLGMTEFKGLVSLPPSLSSTFMAMRFDKLYSLKGISVIFSIFFVSLFDCTGTLVGLIQHAKPLKRHRCTFRIAQGLMSNSITGVLGAILGTSNASPFLESAAGIRAGGRTGLTAWVVGACFLLALFFSPLAATIPIYATAPALLYVACIMFKNVVEVNWDDITEVIPSVLTALVIPYTSSVANGVGLGILSYTLIKTICKKVDEVNPTMVVLSLLFVFYFLMQATVVA